MILTSKMAKRIGFAGAAMLLALSAAEAKTTMIDGFGTTPESCAFGPDGSIYLSVTNKYDTYGDGYVGKVVDGKIVPVATGLNDPHGIDVWNNEIYIADNRGQVWKATMDGVVTKLADSGMFPRKITNLNDIEVDPANGDVYVSDSGDWEGGDGAIFRISKDGAITLVLSDDDNTRLVSPNGLKLDGKGGLLIYDWTTAVLSRLNLADKTLTRINGNLGQGDGIAFGPDGTVYLGAYFAGIKGRAEAGAASDGTFISLEKLGAKSVADIAISDDGKTLCAPDFDGAKLFVLPLDEAR